MDGIDTTTLATRMSINIMISLCLGLAIFGVVGLGMAAPFAVTVVIAIVIGGIALSMLKIITPQALGYAVVAMWALAGFYELIAWRPDLLGRVSKSVTAIR